MLNWLEGKSKRLLLELCCLSSCSNSWSSLLSLPLTYLEPNIMPITSAPSVPISNWAGTNLAEQLSFVSGEKLLLRVFSEVDSEIFATFFFGSFAEFCWPGDACCGKN